MIRMTDYHDNLVFWLLDMHIGKAVSNSIDKRQEISFDDYCKLFSEKSAKWIDDYDWISNLGSVMPKQYFEFTEEQKQSLKAYLDLYYNDFNRFGNMLYGILAHILSRFEKSGKLETSEAKALILNYEFAKAYLIQKFPKEWKEYRTFVESSTTQEEIEKIIKCPECGSSGEDIVSYDSLKWRCKNCCKYFLKNPRRKKQT
jgi:hypothetical protein